MRFRDGYEQFQRWGFTRTRTHLQRIDAREPALHIRKVTRLHVVEVRFIVTLLLGKLLSHFVRSSVARSSVTECCRADAYVCIKLFAERR
jgi:hypothetical protein